MNRRPVAAGLVYFALVFGAGFALGVARDLWALPRFGARAAELLEMPVMLVVILLAGRWSIRRFAVPPDGASRLVTGLVALGALVGAELGMVIWLRGLTPAEYLAARDPVAATVYYALVVLYAALPLLVLRRGR